MWLQPLGSAGNLEVHAVAQLIDAGAKYCLLQRKMKIDSPIWPVTARGETLLQQLRDANFHQRFEDNLAEIRRYQADALATSGSEDAKRKKAITQLSQALLRRWRLLYDLDVQIAELQKQAPQTVLQQAAHVPDYAGLKNNFQRVYGAAPEELYIYANGRVVFETASRRASAPSPARPSRTAVNAEGWHSVSP